MRHPYQLMKIISTQILACKLGCFNCAVRLGQSVCTWCWKKPYFISQKCCKPKCSYLISKETIFHLSNGVECLGNMFLTGFKRTLFFIYMTLMQQLQTWLHQGLCCVAGHMGNPWLQTEQFKMFLHDTNAIS